MANRQSNLASLDWLTIRECANEIGVGGEVVRGWCALYREGKPGGLPYTHFGKMPESQADRVNYRIHVDDWSAFKRERRGEERREAAQVAKAAAAPISYIDSRRERARSVMTLSRRNEGLS